MGLDPDPTGHPRGLDGPIADYSEFLAPLHAGNVAVEELCGGYRLPVVARPASDEAQLAWVEAETNASQYARAQAPVLARKIVLLCRVEVVAIANELLASPDGRLEGQALQNLIAPMWRKTRPSPQNPIPFSA